MKNYPQVWFKKWKTKSEPFWITWRIWCISNKMTKYVHTHTQYKTPCYMIFSSLKPNSEKRRKKGLILKNMWRGKKCLWRFKSQSIEEILEFVPNAKSNCEYEHKLTCIFDLEQWKATIFSPRIDFQASFQLPWKQSSPKELKKGSSWEVA